MDRQINRRWIPIALLVLATLLVLSATARIASIQKHNDDLIIESARNVFRMVVLTRQWNADHGTVYVPSTLNSPPNPYLKHPLRDLNPPDSVPLTMVNPAYMTRQLAELAERSGSMRLHITSRRPIRPENAPDVWEDAALRAFESGQREVSSIENMGQRPMLRYMAPLFVNKSCMKCHAEQGYQIGDIRGGISVSLDYGPIKTALDGEIQRIALTYIAFFVAGGLAIIFLLTQLRRRWSALVIAQNELLETRQQLVHSEKMGTLGQLAAGFADELSSPINNALLALDRAETPIQATGQVGPSPTPAPIDSDEQQRRIAQSNLRHCASLVTHFKHLANDQNTSICRAFRLSDVVSDIVSAIHHNLKLAAVDVQVVCPPSLIVYGPPGVYEQVLANLLLYRLKHGFPEGSPGGHILLNAESTPDEQTLRIRISDDGAGIPGHHISAAFDSGLGQLEQKSMLSLYLARLVVTRELHGTLRCESQPDQGTHFFLDCPLRQPSSDNSENMQTS